MADNPLTRIAAEQGSDLYDGAGTYKVSDKSLKRNTRAIYVREDQAAMITSMKLMVRGTATVQTLELVGADLMAGDFFTFEYPIEEIVIAGGSFIGYQG